MTLKIEYSHRMDKGRCERCTPVVRLGELRRWLKGHQALCEQRAKEHYEMGVYTQGRSWEGGRSSMMFLLAELKEAQP